jgi:hypothetical protein
LLCSLSLSAHASSYRQGRAGSEIVMRCRYFCGVMSRHGFPCRSLFVMRRIYTGVRSASGGIKPILVARPYRQYRPPPGCARFTSRYTSFISLSLSSVTSTPLASIYPLPYLPPLFDKIHHSLSSRARVPAFPSFPPSLVALSACCVLCVSTPDTHLRRLPLPACPRPHHALITLIRMCIPALIT